MTPHVKSIAALVNEIRNGELALPDLQRDFVWGDDQIRTLLDSILRGYPFGSLLLWNTQFLEVVYRDFCTAYRPGQTFQTLVKRAGTRKRMVLDGQQRLQSLYLAFAGTYDGRRLYFNATSGPDSNEVTDEDDLGRNYRFEFWRDDEPNRPKRLVCVADAIGWADKYEDDEIEQVVRTIPLDGEEASLARRNLRLLRRIFTRDLVPVTVVDDDVIKAEQAKTIDEILEIFVRVNSGGTRLSRSDLMFSLIKTKWVRARERFDQLLTTVDRAGVPGIDKDFIIRGLLTVSDVPTAFSVGVIERHWDTIEPNFEIFATALRSAVDFCRSQDVRILSSSLLHPVGTLYPVVYYLSRQKNGSVPDTERQKLRELIYFLLFNEFLGGKSPETRVRYMRDVLQSRPGSGLPLAELLLVISRRQRHHSVATTIEMLQWNPRLTLNIAQPAAARDTLSWQEKAEVDHIFPQSVYRPIHGDLVDDIGNLAYLGKLRNIRKSNDEPSEYFKNTPDTELREDFLIDDRSHLTEGRFAEFIEHRRARILEVVSAFMGGVGPAQAAAENGEPANIDQLKIEFWTALGQYLEVNGKPFAPGLPRVENFKAWGIGRTGFTLAVHINIRDGELRVSIGILGGADTEAHFQLLKAQAPRFEEALGFPLWWRVTGSERQIGVSKQISLSDRTTWPAAAEWATDRMKQLDAAFRPAIGALDASR